MRAAAYYNEIDPFAAEWLKNLIAAGLIAPGEVDTRSIEDVCPADLVGFTQCHFFAGLGGWSYALRRAGWPDSRPVWTGSCPCQPFSAAGEGLGFADERHLWPAFHHLIRERKPAIVLGEQVASKDANPWIDLVHTDMEALGYAFGAVPFPSAGVGAPHIRDRMYWVANADDARLEGRRVPGKRDAQLAAGAGGMAGRLADTDCGTGDQGCSIVRGGYPGGDAQPRTRLGSDGEPCIEWPGPANGFWRDSDWLGCTDGKWRPVESGSFPLAYGLPAGMGKLSAGQRRLAEMAGLDGASLKRAKAYRVGSLRGYGNAINADAALIFIEAVTDSLAAI